MYHWHEPENVQSSPLFLKKNFKIADRQFLWTVLRARAKVKHWPLPTDLDNLLATKVNIQSYFLVLNIFTVFFVS